MCTSVLSPFDVERVPRAVADVRVELRSHEVVVQYGVGLILDGARQTCDDVDGAYDEAAPYDAHGQHLREQVVQYCESEGAGEVEVEGDDERSEEGELSIERVLQPRVVLQHHALLLVSGAELEQYGLKGGPKQINAPGLPARYRLRPYLAEDVVEPVGEVLCVAVRQYHVALVVLHTDPTPVHQEGHNDDAAHSENPPRPRHV